MLRARGRPFVRPDVKHIEHLVVGTSSTKRRRGERGGCWTLQEQEARQEAAELLADTGNAEKIEPANIPTLCSASQEQEVR